MLIKILWTLLLVWPATLGAQGYLRLADPRLPYIEKQLDLLEGGVETRERLRGLGTMPISWLRQSPIDENFKEQLAPTGRVFNDWLTFDLGIAGGIQWVESPSIYALDVQAINNPLLDSDFGGGEGRFYQDGRNGFFDLNFGGEFGSFDRQSGTGYGISLAVDPSLQFSSEAFAYQQKSEFNLRRAYVLLHLNRLQLEVGKNSVQWGVGRLGHLLFAGHNEPLPMVRLRNSSPITPPSFLKWMGPTVVEAFALRLDGDQLFPHPLVIGSKFSFKPTPVLEIGAGTTVQFGGDGASSGNNPLLFFGEYVADENNGASNRNFVLDVRYRSKQLGIEPYMEILVEDCCDEVIINPRDMLNLFGLYVPKLDSEGRLDLTLEWVRTNRITYRHGEYTSGFEYRSRVLGHALGPDANGLYGALRYFWQPMFWQRLLLAFEERGTTGDFFTSANPHTPVDRSETRWRFMTELSKGLGVGNDNLWLTGQLGYERVNHFNFTSGASQNNFLLAANLAYHF